MKGDFSRETFDPKKHYSAVLMQQGRVQVDADWNEQQAIDQYRIETEAVHVIGKCGAPKHDAGFGLTEVDAEFSISQGSFYVDGILCENEAEVLYSNQPDLPNPQTIHQAFHDEKAGIDTDVGMIYLDVWKRHLTALDDSTIREVALNGPDTTTRLKTVWQVKVLPITESVNGLNCDSVLKEWDTLIASSTGTLSVQTAEADETDSPCLIPPNAGYQRLENQLYRVEIHHGSDLDTGVTFKWSRDNGSVVTEIKQISGAEVTVADLGPDDTLGFAKGQWVEILDDALELKGQPGELGQIDDFTTDISGNPVIVMATAPSRRDSGSSGVNPDLHPKLRRWDQTGPSATTTGIALPTGDFSLEGGIQVAFSGGTYKTGDYWLIPARTTTGEIEWPMTDATPPVPIPQKPFGIEHHYCRLAIAQLLPSNTPDHDESRLTLLEVCDHIFCPLTELDPGESCCTVVVQPGENIQAALDSLPPAGGCVCLKTGRHEIRQPIRMSKSNVVLKGESPGTRVTRNNGLSLLQISRPDNQRISNVVVEQIHFEAAGVEAQPTLLNSTLLVMGNGLDVTVQRCRFDVAELQDNRPNSTLPISPTIGIAVVNSRQITLLDNTLSLTLIGIWAEGCTACDFSNNQLLGSVLQLTDLLAMPLGYIGILLNLLPSENQQLGSDCRIANNSIQDFWLGIATGVRSDRCQLLNNQIRRQPITQLPIQTPNNLFLAGNEPYLYGIITYGANSAIERNYLELNSPSYGGIRALGSFTRIAHNTIQSTLTPALLAGSSQLPLALFLGQIAPPPGTQQLFVALNYSVVQSNKILGTLTGIGAANAEGIEILDNQIGIFESVTALSIGVALASTRNTMVKNNQIRGADIGIFLLGDPPTKGIHNRMLGNHLSDGSYGIGAISETALDVSGNLIENMTLAGFAATNLLETAYLTHNRIDHCGYQPPTSDFGSLAATPAIGAGIFIISVLGNLTLDSCQVVNTGISRQGNVIPQGTFWGIAVGLVLVCEIRNNEVYYSDLANLAKIGLGQIHRALLLIGTFLPISNDIPYPQIGNALVTNNIFQGIGFPHLVEFFKNASLPQAGLEQVNFSHNQCFHLRTQTEPTSVTLAMVNIRQGNSTVSIWGRQQVVMGNQVKADSPNMYSIDLSTPERVTLMGNITTGVVFNFGSGVTPTNPSDFNVYP